MPRTLVAWLCAALLPVAACSTADDGARNAAGPDPSVSVASDPPDESTGSPGEPPAEPGSGPDGGAGATAPVAGADPPGPTTTSVQGAPPANTSPAPAPGAVGAYAPFYLRPGASVRVLVDLRSQSGAEPGAGTVDHVRRVLGEVSGKTIEIVGGDIGGDGRQWTPEAIRALADSDGPPQSRDAGVVRLLFLRGGLAGDDTVLGVAVRSDVAAVFSDRVDEAAGVVGNRGRIEAAVTLHEVGHLLGLVDLHLSTGRADPEHPGHSRNSGSVMYYAVESTLVGNILGGGPPTEFDADDLADLAAIRAG